jgi:itaconyl-CoA hydratase
MIAEILGRAVLWEKGRFYGAQPLGEERVHHWGRTFTETDSILFSTLTLAFNPIYTNKEYARELGYRDLVINPLFVFNTALGLSVEDNSEVGGFFLGVEDLVYGQTVYPGDTMIVKSLTKAKRLSANRENMGIITWHTEGRNQHGEMIVEFDRSNFVAFSTLFADPSSATSGE